MMSAVWLPESPGGMYVNEALGERKRRFLDQISSPTATKSPSFDRSALRTAALTGRR